MIALIECPDLTGPESPWGEGVDTCLLNLVDRPMLQHVLESLADCGVQTVHVLMAEPNRDRLDLLGDGARWGMTLRIWHPSLPGVAMRESARQDLRAAGGLVIGRGDTLPRLAELTASDPQAQVLRTAGKSGGWAVLRGEAADDWLGTPDGEQPASPARYRETEWIDTTTPQALLASQRLLLEGSFGPIPLFGREMSPGVWVGRGAKIHKTAVIEAPAYIGAFAFVGPGCRVGAGSAVGESAVLEEGCAIAGSLVSYNTRMGRGLALINSVLIKSVLYSTRFATRVVLEDEALASAI